MAVHLLQRMLEASSKGTHRVGLTQEEVLERLHTAYAAHQASHPAAGYQNLTLATIHRALEDASMYYYIDPWDNLYYHFHWETLLEMVAAEMPYEGLTEPRLVDLFQHQVMVYTASTRIPLPLPPFSIALKGETKEESSSSFVHLPLPDRFGYWLYRYFRHLFYVTRSVSRPECLLYYSAIKPSVLRPFATRITPTFPPLDAPAKSAAAEAAEAAEAEADELLRELFAALGALERDKLPVWSSFQDTVLPLLERIQATKKSPATKGQNNKPLTVEQWYHRLCKTKTFREHFVLRPVAQLQAPKEESTLAGVETHSSSAANPTLVLIDAITLERQSGVAALLEQALKAAGPNARVALLTRHEILEKEAGDEDAARLELEKALGKDGAAVLAPLPATPPPSPSARTAQQKSPLVKQKEAEAAAAAAAAAAPETPVRIPVDDMLDSHHMVSALLERLVEGEALEAEVTVHRTGGTSPLFFGGLVVICGDEALESMQAAVEAVWTNATTLTLTNSTPETQKLEKPRPNPREERERNLLKAVEKVEFYTFAHAKQPVVYTTPRPPTNV